MKGVAVREVEMLSMCSLTAGGRLFGIDTGSIREVLGPRMMHRVPLAPAYIGGLVAYRGEVLTAVCLRSLLGLAPAEAMSCVLVLDGETEGELFGVMVDDVGGVVSVDRRLHTENPTTLDAMSRSLFDGAFRLETGLMVQVNPVRLRPWRLAESGLFGGNKEARP